jgi:hypothetical protein
VWAKFWRWHNVPTTGYHPYVHRFQKLILNLNRLDKAYSVEGDNIRFFGAFLCIQQYLKISMDFHEPWQGGFISQD